MSCEDRGRESMTMEAKIEVLQLQTKEWGYQMLEEATRILL